MKRKRYTHEQIISILKEHEAGQPVGELARRYGVVENTIYRWKSKYGGMEVSDAKWLRELEQENARLKKLLAEAELDKAALKELVRGNMVTVAQRRAAVDHLTDRRYSQRRACRLVGLPRSVAWYRLKGRDDAPLRDRLKVLAERYPRYGYLTLHEMLRQEGRVINRQRTYHSGAARATPPSFFMQAKVAPKAGLKQVRQPVKLRTLREGVVFSADPLAQPVARASDGLSRCPPLVFELSPPILDFQIRDTAKLTCVVRDQGRTERSGMRCNQQIVLADGTTDALKFGPDQSIVLICRLVERYRFDCRQDGGELLSQTRRAATRCPVMQFGGHNNADAEGALLQRDHATCNVAIWLANQIGHDIRIQHVTQVRHARANFPGRKAGRRWAGSVLPEA